MVQNALQVICSIVLLLVKSVLSLIISLDPNQTTAATTIKPVTASVISTTVTPQHSPRCNYTTPPSTHATQVSLGVVFNTRSTMATDLNSIKSGIPTSWLTVILDEPGRIDNFFIVSYGASIVL